MVGITVDDLLCMLVVDILSIGAVGGQTWYAALVDIGLVDIRRCVVCRIALGILCNVSWHAGIIADILDLAPVVDIACMVVEVWREGFTVLLDDVPCLTAHEVVRTEPVLYLMVAVLGQEVAADAVAALYLGIGDGQADLLEMREDTVHAAVALTQHKGDAAQQPGHLDLRVAQQLLIAVLVYIQEVGTCYLRLGESVRHVACREVRLLDLDGVDDHLLADGQVVEDGLRRAAAVVVGDGPAGICQPRA